MKYLVICSLVLAGVLIAGCTSTQAPPGPLPAPTAAPVTTAVTTASPQPFSRWGLITWINPWDIRFSSENDVIVEEFRVDSPSWGINYKIQPLNDDLQYCWFVMNVTNMNYRTDGYIRVRKGHTPLNSIRQFPMYNEGPYTITMKGNRVKVWLKAAKRNP